MEDLNNKKGKFIFTTKQNSVRLKTKTASAGFGDIAVSFVSLRRMCVDSFPVGGGGN